MKTRIIGPHDSTADIDIGSRWIYWALNQNLAHGIQPASHRYLLMVMASQATPEGEVRLKQPMLAALSGLDVRSVRRGFRRFEKLGIVRSERLTGLAGKHNIYHLQGQPIARDARPAAYSTPRQPVGQSEARP